MALSIFALFGLLAGATVAVIGDTDTSVITAADILSRSTSGQVEHAPSRTALRNPSPAAVQSLSRATTAKGALPGSIYQPLSFNSVKPMTGKVSPAIFQTAVDSTNTNGQQRRLALVDADGHLGLLCRDIGVPHRNHQLVQMNGEHIMMRLESPTDKGNYLTARCREAIALLPLG